MRVCARTLRHNSKEPNNSHIPTPSWLSASTAWGTSVHYAENISRFKISLGMGVTCKRKTIAMTAMRLAKTTFVRSAEQEGEARGSQGRMASSQGGDRTRWLHSWQGGSHRNS